MKKLIYVVDDEPLVLSTVVFILQNLDKDWSVTGFGNPLEALAAIKTNKPDLVLADQRMPDMQGSQLLEEVRAVSPGTMRIIASGYIDSIKLSKITSAHVYLCKPFDVPKLRDILRNTFAAQERLQDRTLLTTITALHSLPSIPHVYHTLLRELENTRNSLEVLAQIIAEDPGISTKVLQLANSPLFGQGNLASTPLDAVLCLGTEMVKAVVLSQKLVQQYARLSSPEFDVPGLWKHSWEVAELAKHLCLEKKLARLQSEEAFLAGLLHEVGTLIVMDNFPEKFKAGCRITREKNIPLSQNLRETLQATPAQLAAYLLQLWSMPTSVIEAVAWQEEPEKDQPNEFSPTAALYIADQISTRRTPSSYRIAMEWKLPYLESIGCVEDVRAWEQLGSD